MTRRNLELVLLCIAAPIVILLFAMLILNRGEELGLTTLGVPLGLFGAFVIAHIATRLLAPDADPALLPIVFALSGIGICFVTRLAPNLAVNQVIWLFVSVAAMIVTLAVSRKLDHLANYKYTLMLFGFILLLSPLLPVVGTEHYGSRIWLSFGPFSFQPGELAKIVIVLAVSGYLAANREMLSVFTWRLGPFRLPDLRTLAPLIIMWVIALLIVAFEKDLGSALVFFFVFLAILYVATGKKFYLIVGFLLMLAGIVGAYMLFDHVKVRVANWINPFADPQGAGYQMVQGIYSIADGDLFGVGIGRGLADQIPFVESDYIFAAIAEETGLLGAAGILLLYLSFAIRGYVTAARAKSDFSSLVSAGLTTTICLQAFIIVGGITRVIPLTGITLPFISQGGSSLLSSFIAIGLLLRCGDEGTGVGQEMASVTESMNMNSVLGRVALGERLTASIVLLSLMFALLVANLTLIMVVQAGDYQSMPGNNHTVAKQAAVKRGTISTYDGTVLAQSVETEDGTYERVYPAGDLASQVVGYYSTRYGTSGIENTYDDTLAGDQNYANWLDVLNAQAGITKPGHDVVLTLDTTIQQAAQNALDGYAGACIVIDPKSGAILGMASSPTYDASEFESVLQASADGGEDTSLLNRATQTQYAPGSTFKMVTLATAFENDAADENTVYDSPGEMEIGGGTVTNFNNNSLGNITLETATVYSSNTAFAQLGVEMGAEMLVEGAKKFGFNDRLSFDLPLAQSIMADPKDMSEWETAWAAAGQPVGDEEDTGPRATVLQMALVGCAMANDGTIMTPYLVDGVYNANGQRSFTATQKPYLQAISKKTAERVTAILEEVVSSGTGVLAQIDGVSVAGKTGTAETGKPNDDSWFVGYAPADNPQVVVAIVLEEAIDSEYSDNAALKSQNVLQTALQIKGIL
ncbi:MAG: FtsW/RodA/SpoVE family cell cycle protein [Eggerthellaceae bacterium]|nr:FtsW/RodA/SpoVE family cell cycle protein [Eggerthellaceae bacterium]